MANYYRIWLFVPLLFALIGYAVPVVGDFVLFKFVEAGIGIAHIPYIAFVIAALAWSLLRKSTDYRLAFILSPFIFGLFYMVYAYFELGQLTNGGEPLPFIQRIDPVFTILSILVSTVFSWGALLLWYVFKRSGR